MAKKHWPYLQSLTEWGADTGIAAGEHSSVASLTSVVTNDTASMTAITGFLS